MHYLDNKDSKKRKKNLCLFSMDANIFKSYFTESVPVELMATKEQVCANNRWKHCCFKILVSRKQ